MSFSVAIVNKVPTGDAAPGTAAAGTAAALAADFESASTIATYLRTLETADRLVACKEMTQRIFDAKDVANDYLSAIWGTLEEDDAIDTQGLTRTDEHWHRVEKGAWKARSKLARATAARRTIEGRWGERETHFLCPAGSSYH